MPTEAADVRRTILGQAARLFVAHGYHGISMREIAEAVGVSKAGLYYHFKHKEALFLTILEADLAAVELIVRGVRESGLPARGQVARLVHDLLALAPEQRAIIRLANQEMSQLAPEARDAFGRMYHQHFIGQIESVLAEAVARGELRPLDTATITWILLGMLYPFFFSERGPLANEALAEQVVAVFFDGVGA